jgi:8-oxo-dGTP pyrophosphatase MutT (NUDIX family)
MSLWRLTGRAIYWLFWLPGWVYARFTTRARVLIRSGDQVLLVQGWIDDGTWGLPGGGLRRHETPAQGAAREVAEETGVPVAPGQCRLLASEWRSYRGIRYFCHYLAVELPARPKLQTHPREIAAACWFPLDALPNMPCKPEVTRALELLAKR